MEKISPILKQKIKMLPDSSGVYLMKDKKGEILYIGKALSLKNRVKSYFSSKLKFGDSYQRRIQRMVSLVADFEYILTPTEEEAYLLEANLIKQHRPQYNVSLKDDKQYPFIKITVHEPFPRVIIDRQKLKDGSRYFGPYTDASSIRRTLRFIEWQLPLRTCKRVIDPEKATCKNACFNYQLGKCPAPCIGKVSKEEYRRTVNKVISYLSGKNKEIIDYLQQEMIECSQRMDYEKAARMRDQIKVFEKIQKSKTTYFMDEENRDVVAAYKEDKLAVVTVLKIIGGKLLSKENFRLENREDADIPEILSAFLNQYYADKEDALPHRILLPEEPDDYQSLNKLLKNRLHIPQRGDYRVLMRIAMKNAFNFLETIKLSHLRKANRTIYPIQELKDKLGLDSLPRKIICLDISTIQGSDTVGAIVSFENGKPRKKGYRLFRIKTFQGQDDYAAMREVLSRYFDALPEEEKPNLLVIDGGKGQLRSALEVMKSYPGIAVISLAKRVEEIYLPDRKTPVFLPRSSAALRILVAVRDEAHRFAIGYHRKRRSGRTIHSEMDEIKGIGNKTKFLLLKHFGSVESIRKASVDELTAVKGIGGKTANLILLELNRGNEADQ